MLVKSVVYGGPLPTFFRTGGLPIGNYENAGEYCFVTAFRNSYLNTRFLTQDLGGVAAPLNCAIRKIEEGY
jgi:hypothetical protein